MRNQKKAEEMATQRFQLISPLLMDGLDPAKAKQVKSRYVNRVDCPKGHCDDI